MGLRLLVLMWGMTLVGCAHGPCRTLGAWFGCTCVRKQEPPEFQDMRIRLPVFDSALKTDAELDGYTLQAIRVAAEDLLPPDSPDLPCISRPVSYKYKALRQGDIIFVRIKFRPQSCGSQFDMLDDGATYAISLDGRILRRAIDGTEPSYELFDTPNSERSAPEANSVTAPEGG